MSRQGTSHRPAPVRRLQLAKIWRKAGGRPVVLVGHTPTYLTRCASPKCDNVFQATRADQRVCSAACRAALSRALRGSRAQ